MVVAVKKKNIAELFRGLLCSTATWAYAVSVAFEACVATWGRRCSSAKPFAPGSFCIFWCWSVFDNFLHHWDSLVAPFTGWLHWAGSRSCRHFFRLSVAQVTFSANFVLVGCPCWLIVGRRLWMFCFSATCHVTRASACCSFFSAIDIECCINHAEHIPYLDISKVPLCIPMPNM